MSRQEPPCQDLLDALVEHARRDGPSPQQLTQLVAQVSGTLAGAATGATSISHLPAWLKGLSVGVGAAALMVTISVATQYRTPPSPQPKARPISPAEPTVAPIAVPEPPAVILDIPAARVHRNERPSETELLEEARRVLPRAPARALALTRRHGRRYPRGVLTQEREVIAIEALLGIGRVRAAEGRATRFFVAHPHSAYGSRIRQVLRAGGGGGRRR